MCAAKIKMKQIVVCLIVSYESFVAVAVDDDNDSAAAAPAVLVFRPEDNLTYLLSPRQSPIHPSIRIRRRVQQSSLSLNMDHETIARVIPRRAVLIVRRIPPIARAVSRELNREKPFRSINRLYNIL